MTALDEVAFSLTVQRAKVAIAAAAAKTTNHGNLPTGSSELRLDTVVFMKAHRL
jgi:hypothetical protein